MPLSDPERLKFRLLAEGITLTAEAETTFREAAGNGPLSSADFASTSGLILQLSDDVWVNAPIAAFNPNFVKSSPYVLRKDTDGFVVEGEGLGSAVHYWPQPAYHGSLTESGRPINHFAVTHGDRVRLSPMMGCSMVCKFCDVPYETRYGLKPLDTILESVGRSLKDPVQPARHLLISGGTPRSEDFPYLKSIYRAVLTEFPQLPVDIMMVPVSGLLDLAELVELGVNELSINIEVYSDDAAYKLMRQKFRHGREHYLDFIETATKALGAGRVRSMLIVGLEPLSETLRGVKAIIDRGGVPVLSPFRPDPSTPLKDHPPPSANELEEAYLRATDLALKAGAALGPKCVPCMHNTLTLPSRTGAPSEVAHHPMTLI